MKYKFNEGDLVTIPDTPLVAKLLKDNCCCITYANKGISGVFEIWKRDNFNIYTGGHGTCTNVKAYKLKANGGEVSNWVPELALMHARACLKSRRTSCQSLNSK